MKTQTVTKNVHTPVTKTKVMTAKDRILKLLRNRSKGLTAREIAEKASVNYNTCRKLLGNLLSSHLFTDWDKKKKLTTYSMNPF
jgi:predicted transcriptional regulator